MTVEYYILGGLVTLLVGLVVHLLTKNRMNDKFTEQMNKMREHYADELVVLRREFVSRQTCEDCKKAQGERKDFFIGVTNEIKEWLQKVEGKIDDLTTNLLKK